VKIISKLSFTADFEKEKHRCNYLFYSNVPMSYGKCHGPWIIKELDTGLKDSFY